jgi:cysteinyl-tRNA synthetase
MALRLYNTRTRKKEIFRPLDAKAVRMYVCGPTVYDFAHIGNARPIIVFDVLFRLLRHIYGPEHVTYVRNITDVDDKINARAAELYPHMPPEEAIARLTSETTAQFHRDVAALGCLPPTHEPRATGYIDEMKAMIEALHEAGVAYVAEDHVLFSVAAYGTMNGVPAYGSLARRSLDEMIAGARVEVAPYKRDPVDFVLWKPSKPGEPGWPSPLGIAAPGRPGWHLECSAMSKALLGERFDIHGGGIDLVFPHHENEVAQSCAANRTPMLATLWMHNGFLQVEGQKMSKSLGNFITIHDLLATRTFGHTPWHGRVIRFAMLMTHYRQPMDWTVDRLVQARTTLQEWSGWLSKAPAAPEPHPDLIASLLDDLNLPAALAVMHGLARHAQSNAHDVAALRSATDLLGLYGDEPADELDPGAERKHHEDEQKVKSLMEARNAARKARNWAEADRIRDELAAMGIRLKDTKDPETGEIVTTWDIAR